MLKAAKKLDCKFLVTGHYARIKKTKNKFELLRAKDESKDQSYFLYRLKQKELSRILFPIGDLTEVQVREIAKKNKFPNYDKKSTVGICFIGKVNLKKFLQKKLKPKSGKILDPEGNQIGTHDGIYYYTIGQRIGPRFGIEVDKKEKIVKKWYVAKKDSKTNTIIAAPEGHKLNFRKEISIKNPRWINDNLINNLIKKISSKNIRGKLSDNISNKSASTANLTRGGGVGLSNKKEISVHARIRQVGELLPSKISFRKNKIKVILKKAITGVSEGQACVLYKGKVCLGGGVISFI